MSDVDQLLERAIAAIVDDCSEGTDGPAWENLIRTGDSFQVTHSNVGLYDGSNGIVLALAMAANSLDLGDPAVDAVIKRYTHHLQKTVTDPATPLGAFNGVAGTAYAAACLNGIERYSSPDLRATAAAGLARLEAHLSPSVGHDIVSGLGGILAVMTSLERAGVGDPAALSRIEQACVGMLSSSSVATAAGRVWHPPGTEWLGGFSHGVAGVAWALARSSVVGARDLAQSAWNSQLALFDEATSTWVDRRETADPGNPFEAWCHGGDGILLACRDVGLRLPDTPYAAEWFDAWSSTSPPASETLCHGRAGRLAALSWFASRHDLHAESHRQALRTSVAADLARSIDGTTVFGLNSSLLLGTAGSVLALIADRDERLAGVPLLLEIPSAL